MSVTTKGKRDMLRQVLLRHPTENGYAEDVFWIDNKLAKVNKRVIDEDNIVWTIIEIYNAREFVDVDRTRRNWKDFADKIEGH